MKKQITIALLLIASAFTACKKEEGPHVEIVGTWKVLKVETLTAGSTDETYIGTPSDNIEFRGNDANEMVVNLNSVSAIGHYVILENNGIIFSYSGKNRTGKITKLTANELEFNGVIEGDASVKTEKYYLSK